MKRKLAITKKTMMIKLEYGMKKEGIFITKLFASLNTIFFAKLNATFKEDTLKEENEIE